MRRVLQLPELIALRQFSGYGAGWGEPRLSPRTSWVELMELSVQGKQRAKSSQDKILKKRKLHGDWATEVCGWSLWVCSRSPMSSFLCESYLRLGKRSSKRIRGNSATLSHSATNSESSHNSDWKTLWFVAHGKLGRGLEEFCLSGD